MAETAFAAERVRRHDNDRFLSTLFAPPEARDGLSALYAFNLEIAGIRESVSQPELGLMRLAWWRQAMDGIHAGHPPRHPAAEALAVAIGKFDLPRAPFETLLDARELDMADTPPADLADLVAYAEGTSGSLTRLALAILGENGAAAATAGRHVGIAWALIGLMRAVPFHAAAGRVYLPQSLCREWGLDSAAIGPGTPLSPVVSAIVREARRHLQAAAALGPQVPRKALPALLPATLARGYLKTLEKTGFNPFDGRVQAAGAGRIVRLVAAGLRGRY